MHQRRRLPRRQAHGRVERLLVIDGLPLAARRNRRRARQPSGLADAVQQQPVHTLLLPYLPSPRARRQRLVVLVERPQPGQQLQEDRAGVPRLRRVPGQIPPAVSRFRLVT